MSRNRALEIKNTVGQREEHVGKDHQPTECIEDAGQLSPHQCDGPHAEADQAPEGEKKLGFQPSMIYEVPHDPSPCWLIVGDKGWQHAPPMVGLFTLFIRLGIMHKLGADADETLKLAKDGKIKIGTGTEYAGNRDCSYISQAWKGIQVILKHGMEIFYEKMEDNYPKDLPNRGPSLHDDFGPVNFSQRSPEEAMPHWYREKYWK